MGEREREVVVAESSPIAEECVGEVVSWQQWDVVMGTVERNFKHHTNRNVTEAEIQQRLRDFKRPLKFELGFVTMSPNPNDETPKPVKYQIRGPEGEVVYGGPPQPVTQDELSKEDFVGGKGPYYVCFQYERSQGTVDIDIGYFHINLPEAIGTQFEKSSWKMADEDLRDMQPTITAEELEYFAKEEHILSLKQDTRKLGGAVYHAHNEQQHIKQIQIWQTRLLGHVAYKLSVYGVLRAFVFIACAAAQSYLIRRLFSNKKVVVGLGGGFEDL